MFPNSDSTAYSYAPLVPTPPPPVRLHWGWVLALSAVTFGFFTMVWLMVQAVWVKKISGKTRQFWLSLAYVLYLPTALIAGFAVGIYCVVTKTPSAEVVPLMKLFIQLYGFVLYVWLVFSMKSALEEEPIGIPLSGVMTFFFGAIYFQYHLHDYGEIGGASASFSSPSGLGLNGAAPIAQESGTPPEG